MKEINDFKDVTNIPGQERRRREERELLRLHALGGSIHKCDDRPRSSAKGRIEAVVVVLAFVTLLVLAFTDRPTDVPMEWYSGAALESMNAR